MTTVEEISKDLNALDDEIKKAESESAQISGRLEEANSSLSGTFGTSSVDDGLVKIEEMKKKRVEVQSRIESVYSELKEKYDW